MLNILKIIGSALVLVKSGYDLFQEARKKKAEADAAVNASKTHKNTKLFTCLSDNTEGLACEKQCTYCQMRGNAVAEESKRNFKPFPAKNENNPA